MRQKGLVIVFTGEGKGKTSAALGVAMRSAGHKMYVSMVQFIKSASNTGEAAAAERLDPEFEFIPMGRGFVINSEAGVPLSEHKRAAEAALLLACERAQSGSWDVLILDEINNAIKLGLLDINDVVDLVRNKPEKLHLILTGRDAHPDIIALADLVTEMRPVKHPYDKGILAQKGIDF
jgi:cob(I)alamin adenosyltransferase